ncbi:cation efflux protein [Fistulina hepatica ATCC 64428]|uniref:Cation efflux protein n=1 Tax=Fistulina hepatica ATCC 64428 TaxID=1128425 RepID=A0A0D7AGP7_9AGAR|nr:cation efflux protein [Fistulina hepatica ATCC 64428]
MFSRSARIIVLLTIDVLFFFVELVVGYAVGSLALVADSFHMLNDVMSLVVALYAIKLSSAGVTPDSRYSYGWHRAEILAALINGVFLLALCLSISLEALQRFFSTPGKSLQISNPKLVVIVGSLGLISNITGLFLFREHGHGHDHSHSHSYKNTFAEPTSLPSGCVTPTPNNTRPPKRSRSHPSSPSRSSLSSSSRSRSNSYSSLYGHPAATRATLIQTAHEMASQSPAHRSRSDMRSASRNRGASQAHSVRSPLPESSETTPLLASSDSTVHEQEPPYREHITHQSHGHDHGSMNMRALVLHVMGDALGNIGVIAAGLIIWLTTWTYKFYFDPIISLVITVIIFSSAMPLVRSASFILLQGVPPTVSLDEVREAILAVEGVLSLHELHVWQLSETQIIASVHVMASRKHDFMPVASNIRHALHDHGIHSSTIQPEYFCGTPLPPNEHSEMGQERSCLIECPQGQCDPQMACCPPPPIDV